MNIIVIILQMWLFLLMGIYFSGMIKQQKKSGVNLHKDSAGELAKLRVLQKKRLTLPLTEKTRPKDIEEIVGQGDAIRALKAALCGKNPQHIILYGPPGVGKTAAARTVLEYAKKNPESPFDETAKFIEMDATTLRYDERGIADPLMGSVHDPIYQGAGALGIAGIPQPKPGAVTKAHGGVLFIDEIGELGTVQMNKLLKVLEDRKVFFESAYYSKSNRDIPAYIHEIFEKGLPADFRLVAATTSNPEEIPPALRSRCTEIFFKPLKKGEIRRIGAEAAKKTDLHILPNALDMLTVYADNGREAVNIIQTASSVAMLEKREIITVEDMEWVVENTRCTPKIQNKVSEQAFVGKVNGLAVTDGFIGRILNIEVFAKKTSNGRGALNVTGIIERECFNRNGQTAERTSTAKASVENAVTVLNELCGIHTKNYNIHVNFPGGMPVDGPSAGVAIFTAIYSAVKDIPIPNQYAFTGEISLFGDILPVGGITEKIAAAKDTGCHTVYIPMENDKLCLHKNGINVKPICNIEQLLSEVCHREKVLPCGDNADILSAEPL